MAISSTITHGITLATSGVYASPLTITKTGEIQASSGDAIYGPNTHVWTVSNAGTITATGTSDGIDLRLGGSVANASTGSIVSSYTGISIEGSSGTVANFGTITGQSENGVQLTAGGSVTNGQSGSSGGLISGQYFGVYVKGGLGTVINFGTISEAAAGVGTGVLLLAGGSVTNASTGSIESHNAGIGIHGSSGTVSNLGTVSGAGKYGVGLYTGAGGSVTNGQSGSSGGLISGYSDGVVADAGVVTVANFGTITAASTSGVGVALFHGGSVTNGGTGDINASISGGIFGAYIRDIGTVDNLGTIIATDTNGRGVGLAGGGSVTNGGTGDINALISGGTYGAYIGHGIGTVDNLGTITAASISGDGVRLTAGGRVTNGASGSIAGGRDGHGEDVSITGGIGTVSNLGTIAYSGAAYGIALESGGSVTNGASGLIANVFKAIAIDGGIGTVSNLGTVTGYDGVGVLLKGGGSVTNGGTGAINASIYGRGYGVELKAGGTVTNFGIVSGYQTGVYLSAGGTIIVNRDALIRGNGNLGGLGTGIRIGGGAGTVIAAGAISGNNGTAIQFGTFSDLLILDPGVQIAGKVDGGLGTDNLQNNTLELAAGTAAGTLSGLGTQFVGFGHVIVDAGADWTVGAAFLGFGQTIAASGGSSRLVLQSAGTIDLSGVSGFPTIALAGLGATSISLNNANLVGLSSPVITVIGGNFGNTVDASALTGSNRVILVGGLRPDHFTGGAGNDVFKFSAATLGASDTVVGGAGSDELLMTSAGTITAGGVSGVETIRLASGAANSLTLKSSNFTGVAGQIITVDDGNSGNTVSASTLPSADAIIVHAGSGADTLKGGAGNDVFFAGGKTKMTGGAGKNQFTFAHIGTNTIADFSTSATNQIAFSNSGFALGLSGATSTPQALPGSRIGSLSSGIFSNTTQRFAYKQSTGQLFFSSDGSGGTAHLVATLTGDPALTAGRLFFVT